VRDLVERMLKASGRRVDLSSPFVDATLPDGSRLHVVIPDVTREHWAVNIRKFVVRARHLDDLVRLGTLTPHAAAFLHASVRAGLNVLVAGGTQAGKTTMLNCLAGAIDSRERVVTCEEVFELQLSGRDVVSMQCRQPSLEGTGEIPLRRLVKESLRMRPSRIIVGEVRQEESLDMLLALNSGLPGMCTVHANSAREALTKMCTLPLLAGENVSARFVVPTQRSRATLSPHATLDLSASRRRCGPVPGPSSGSRQDCTPAANRVKRQTVRPLAPKAPDAPRRRPNTILGSMRSPAPVPRPADRWCGSSRPEPDQMQPRDVLRLPVSPCLRHRVEPWAVGVGSAAARRRGPPASTRSA